MITPEQIQKFSPRDGDVFVMPEGTPIARALEVYDAIRRARPGVKIMIIGGDIRRADPAEMNAAGWYRA